MSVKLVNVENLITMEHEFGTCELCFQTGALEQQTLIFEDGRGNLLKKEMGFLDYWGYQDKYFFENVVNFGYYINEEKIETLEELEERFDELYEAYKETERNN